MKYTEELSGFLRLFPKMTPPLTLTDESIFKISKEHPSISAKWADEIIQPWEPDYQQDETTEYVPCMRLDIHKDITTLIYWRARAMDYSYFLVNLDRQGQFLDRRLIGGLMAQGGMLVRIYASIDADYIIYMAGQHDEDTQEEDQPVAHTHSLEVMSSGEIITS